MVHIVTARPFNKPWHISQETAFPNLRLRWVWGTALHLVRTAGWWPGILIKHGHVANTKHKRQPLCNYSGHNITESLGNVTVRGEINGKSKGGARWPAVCLSMYSITENIFYSHLSSVAILLQPDRNCFHIV
jgi:hypothetical protein